MKHSQRANSEFGRPAGNSGEIRIRRWTQSSQWRGLVIPISCIGAYDGKQARREGTARLLQGTDGHTKFLVRSITPAKCASSQLHTAFYCYFYTIFFVDSTHCKHNWSLC